MLASRSSFHMRLSNGNDSLNFSIKGSVAPVKRPPQSFFSAGLWLFSVSDMVPCERKIGFRLSILRGGMGRTQRLVAVSIAVPEHIEWS